MQDWLLTIAPIALVVYFLENPGQLRALMNWFERLVY
jgi:hypothetical protein